MKTSRRTLDRLWALLAVAVLTGFAVLLVTGHYVADGPVLLKVTPSHGLHGGDLIVVAAWVTGVASVLALFRRGT